MTDTKNEDTYLEFISNVAPYKVGIVVDLEKLSGLSDMFPLGVEFALRETFEQGLVDRPVEVIVKEFKAQPATDGFSTIKAYRELVEEGVASCGRPYDHGQLPRGPAGGGTSRGAEYHYLWHPVIHGQVCL